MTEPRVKEVKKMKKRSIFYDEGRQKNTNGRTEPTWCYGYSPYLAYNSHWVWYFVDDIIFLVFWFIVAYTGSELDIGRLEIQFCDNINQSSLSRDLNIKGEKVIRIILKKKKVILFKIKKMENKQIFTEKTC